MSASLWRSVTRKIHAARFRVFDARRYDSLTLERIYGKPFLVLPGVFNPALFWSSGLLLQAIQAHPLAPGARVLDLGTGTGVGGIFAAARGARVVCVDVNPEAVRCARINAALNGVDDLIEIYEGDLFEPVRGRRFDLITFNPPFLSGHPADPLEGAFYSTNVLGRFFDRLLDHLKPESAALLVLSSDTDPEVLKEAADQGIYQVNVVRERKVLGETLSVYCFRPSVVPEATRC